MNKYSIEEHIHRFAIWTSARSVQRGFTTTETISKAIEQTKLRTLLKENTITTNKKFDAFHRKICRDLIVEFKKMGEKCSFGRAAKITAVYIKTAIIIRDSGKSKLSKIAHPPIDRVLLKNLGKKLPLDEFKHINWTQMVEKDYNKLINFLRKNSQSPFWELEYYWEPYSKKS